MSLARLTLVVAFTLGFCGWRWRAMLAPRPTLASVAGSSARQLDWGWAVVGDARLPIRIYDLTELVGARPDDAAIDTIIAKLRRAVAPTSWRDGRDAYPSIRKLMTELVIAQTPENHLLVAHEIAWMKWRHRTSAWIQRSAWVVVPMLAFAFAFEVMLARRRQRGAIRNQRCLRCGYDLRASPERCPECGTIRASERPGSLPAGSGSARGT